MSQNNIYLIVGGIYFLVIGYDILNWIRFKKHSAKEYHIARLKSTINFLVLITGITLTVFATCYHINFFNYSPPMEYSQINDLTLQDFKGFKIPGSSLHGNTEFAFIVTSIDYEIKDAQITITARFHPSRSYVFNEKLVDKSLLQHELYHFHITELFARKVRKNLTDFKSMPEAQKVSEIINQFRNEEDKMQQEYDYDSYHSYVLKEQKKWEKKIDSLLTLHQNYASPTLFFK